MGDEVTVELTPNIKKKIIKKGKVGRRPALGWSCKIDLTWVSQNKKENLEMKIGDATNETERLLERCLESMYLEEESLFHIKDCEVLITLTSFTEKPYIFQWTDEEKMEASNAYKELGAKLFKEDRIQDAFYKFSLALKLTCLLDAVLEEDEQDKEVNTLRVALYNNLASCHLKSKNYTSVIKLCNESLNLIPNVKAYYRRALAYIEEKEYLKAESDLIDLFKIEPKNKAALEKYKLVRELNRTNRENYEAIVKKMFG